ncbi:MAG: prolyl oligopeptidase family serine peptidase [Myxococcota bacterium]
MARFGRRSLRIAAMCSLAVTPGLACTQDGAKPPATTKAGAPGKADAKSPTPPPPATNGQPTDEAPAVATKPIPTPPSGPHPFGARDMIATDRLSGHAVSPDGKTIVFVRRQFDHATGKRSSDLWTVPAAGGDAKPLVEDNASDRSPQWSPDGKHIYMLSSRSGSSQVWRVNADGSAPTQVTDLPLPVANLKVSPAGDRIAFTTDVFVDCKDLACTKARLDDAEADPSTGQTYDQMFVRHWDTWKDGRRSHLFTMALSGGEPVDVTKGQDADIPSKPFGGADEYTFSPNGKTLVYTAREVGASEPWSTNFDLFSVAADGRGERVNLTSDNPAWDTHPVFSPDGKTLAWTAMERAGYEADRFGIKMRSWPEGETRTVAESWDRSARSLSFAPDGASLLVTAQHVGQVALFRIGLADDAVTELAGDGTISGAALAGDRIVFARHDLRRPSDLWSIPAAGGEATALTELNRERLSGVQMGEPEQWNFPGWNDETVYAYAVKPVGFEEGKKYPLAFLIHGGPQGSFGNKFHYRWNPQTYAGAGYAVVMIDFHGSTGYGQDFTDSIGGDWGGKPLVDLQRGLKAATDRFDWIDGDKVCALGASYGGFMINWIEGNWPDRFRCLVNHDGVFDQRSMYYATEELWFPEWEHGGPYYANADAYEKHNPVRFVENWKTPMFVIHGTLDYRVPETQGLGAFTALQRRGIDSRFLRFGDENHWVLNPANSLQWHAEVESWLDRWLGATAG